MGITAAAGPFSNLVLAAVFAIPLRLGLVTWGTILNDVLRVFVITNVGLAVFNLIPLPPLDGFSVLQGLLGTVRTQWAYEWGQRLDSFAPYGPIALLVLLSLGWLGIGDILGTIMGPPMSALWGLLVG
jgi:Zn-dependent protease